MNVMWWNFPVVKQKPSQTPVAKVQRDGQVGTALEIKITKKDPDGVQLHVR